MSGVFIKKIRFDACNYALIIDIMTPVYVGV